MAKNFVGIVDNGKDNDDDDTDLKKMKDFLCASFMGTKKNMHTRSFNFQPWHEIILVGNNEDDNKKLLGAKRRVLSFYVCATL